MFWDPNRAYIGLAKAATPSKVFGPPTIFFALAIRPIRKLGLQDAPSSGGLRKGWGVAAGRLLVILHLKVTLTATTSGCMFVCSFVCGRLIHLRYYNRYWYSSCKCGRVVRFRKRYYVASISAFVRLKSFWAFKILEFQFVHKTGNEILWPPKIHFDHSIMYWTYLQR